MVGVRSIAVGSLLVMAMANAAAAQPVSVALEVEGSCPERGRLQRALEAEGLRVEDAAAVVLRVEQGQGQSTMVLEASGGLELARRTAGNHDCEAVADAFAVIAAMRLAVVESVSEEPKEPAPVQTNETPAEATEIGEAGAETEVEESARQPHEQTRADRRQSTAEKPARPVRVAAAPAIEAAGPGAHPIRASRRADYVVSASLSGGLDSGVGPSAAAGFGGALALAGNGRGRGVRLSLARAAGDSDGEVIRWSAWAARLELFGELRRDALWLRPGVGGALVMTRIDGTGLATMPTVVRTQPALAGSLVGGLELGSRISLRAELAGNLFPVADNYLFGGAVVAQSARATLSAGLGLQIDTDW